VTLPSQNASRPEDGADVCERALPELRSVLQERFGVENYSHVVVAYGRVEPRGTEEPLVVQHVTEVNRNAETVRTPAVTFEEVVENTPSELRVSGPGADREITCPVFVWKTAQITT